MNNQQEEHLPAKIQMKCKQIREGNIDLVIIYWCFFDVQLFRSTSVYNCNIMHIRVNTRHRLISVITAWRILLSIYYTKWLFRTLLMYNSLYFNIEYWLIVATNTRLVGHNRLEPVLLVILVILLVQDIHTIPSAGTLLTEPMSIQTLYKSVVATVFLDLFTVSVINTIDMVHLYIPSFILGFCSKQERSLYIWRIYVWLIYSESPPRLFSSGLLWTLPIFAGFYITLQCLVVIAFL